jgi:hypothetical protein
MTGAKIIGAAFLATTGWAWMMDVAPAYGQVAEAIQSSPATPISVNLGGDALTLPAAIVAACIIASRTILTMLDKLLPIIEKAASGGIKVEVREKKAGRSED